MPIDINLLREDRGGNPELVKESQRRRFASVELVDQVRGTNVGLYAHWRWPPSSIDLLLGRGMGWGVWR